MVQFVVREALFPKNEKCETQIQIKFGVLLISGGENKIELYYWMWN